MGALLNVLGLASMTGTLQDAVFVPLVTRNPLFQLGEY